MIYDVGDPWAYYIYVTDINGNPANAGTMTVTLTAPDGTTPTVTVSNPSTGTYLATCSPLNQSGRWTVSYVATGANACADQDQIDVRPSPSTALISLADAKENLRIPQTDSSQDEQLRVYIDVVTDMIETETGPWLPRTVTETVTATGYAFFLWGGPVISITSFAPILTDGCAYVATDFTVTTAGQVTRLDGCLLSGEQYQVTYVAGRPNGIVPPRIQQAARVLLQHLWHTQRSSGNASVTSDADQGTDPTMPNRVRELLRYDRLVSVA